MATPIEDLFEQASILDEQDRATLAGLLLESLEQEADEDIESAWFKEIELRIRELDAGESNLIPWEEVKENLRLNPGGLHPD